MNCEPCIVWQAIVGLADFLAAKTWADQRFRAWRLADSADGDSEHAGAWPPICAGIELQFNNNDVQERGDLNPRNPSEFTRSPGVRLKPGSATSPRAGASMPFAPALLPPAPSAACEHDSPTRSGNVWSCRRRLCFGMPSGLAKEARFPVPIVPCAKPKPLLSVDKCSCPIFVTDIQMRTLPKP